jgi:hypothetical protein
VNIGIANDIVRQIVIATIGAIIVIAVARVVA